MPIKKSELKRAISNKSKATSGFMGLNSWIESDTAADAFANATEAALTELNAELNEKHSELNTPSALNVLLALEGFAKGEFNKVAKQKLSSLAKKAMDQLTAEIDEAKRSANSDDVKMYNRMLAAGNRCISAIK